MFLLPPTTFTEMIYGGSYLRCILLAPVGLGKTAGVLWHIFRLLPKELLCNQCPQSMLDSLSLSSLLKSNV